jgi:hypothetical protein
MKKNGMIMCKEKYQRKGRRDLEQQRERDRERERRQPNLDGTRILMSSTVTSEGRVVGYMLSVTQ